MASHSYLMQAESAIIDASEAVQSLTAAYRGEQERESSGRCYPGNRDVWGTLHVNALALRADLDRLITAMSAEFSE
jgi:hypothetical protein